MPRGKRKKHEDGGQHVLHAPAAPAATAPVTPSRPRRYCCMGCDGEWPTYNGFVFHQCSGVPQLNRYID